MREVADAVFHLSLGPRSAVNAYLLGDVLVDAGAALHGKRVLKALAGRAVSRHVITHAHVDHAGGSRRIVDALRIPVSGGAADVEALHAGRSIGPPRPRMLDAVADRIASYPALPEATALEPGEVVGPGFVVLDTPGHSAGHVSFWRADDGVLVCGDVVNAMHLLTTRAGLHEPPAAFTPDPARNRRSIRAIADLEPKLLLAGHGPALRDPVALRRFADGLVD
ncbi:MAG: MBL fold metallo-hydrolase [Solirubrobacteraceae bacterium]|nr:MBL fold metallo-hydrolase [Solirubrobacteraceae bacterium]